MLFAPPGVSAVHGMPHERPIHHGHDSVASALSPFLGRRRPVTMGLWTRSSGRLAPLRTREDTPRTRTLPTRRWPAWRRFAARRLLHLRSGPGERASLIHAV